MSKWYWDVLLQIINRPVQEAAHSSPSSAIIGMSGDLQGFKIGASCI
jgi:hypothetical protein